MPEINVGVCGKMLFVSLAVEDKNLGGAGFA